MTRSVFLALLIVFTVIFGQETVLAQSGAGSPSAVGTSLETEIQNTERAIARQGITPAQRHEALIRLARLRQLSGDIEGAARNWLEAATAIPGRVDDSALLNCAYCLAAMGEWDRAATALEPLLPRMPRARFLNFSINAIRTGNTSSLAAIADNPEYSEMKAEIIFILWKVTRGSSADRWRQRLVAEFPQSPEGRLAAGESATIAVRPSPFWLFASGLDSLPLTGSVTAGRPSQTTTASSSTASVAQATPAAQTQTQTQTQTQSQAQTQTQTQTQTSSPSSARLQTGIYSRQANAQAQVTSLRNAGFSPTIERRVVNNNEMWAVTVPVGANQTQTVNALRAAGFDSFLVR